MQHANRWLFLILIISGLGLTACSSETETAEKINPAEVVPVEGSEFNHVILTERAVERLDIRTATVSEETITRTLSVGGEVAVLQDDDGEELGEVLVRVSLSTTEVEAVDMEQDALVSPLTDNEDGLPAQLVEPPEVNANAVNVAVYFEIDSAEHNLSPGQRVRVELTLDGSEVERLVLPYGAVIYGLNGETWAYINIDPLIYMREPITIDYIEGDTVVLLEGPPIGTEVVITGAAELYGVEIGVGSD